MDNEQKIKEETFESTTWRNAVNAFTNSHKPEHYLQFLRDYTTPEDTKKQVVSAQKNASSKYGGVVGKVLEKIEIFTNMGDLAIKAAPESIGLAWTGIRLCLNAFQDDYDTFQLYTGACTDIIGIMISCRVYGKSYSYKDRPPEFNELHEKVLEYIGQAYQNILEFSFQMWRYTNEHTAMRLAKGLLRSKKAIVKSSIDAIHTNEDQMNKFAEQASRQSLDYYQRQGLQNDQTILNSLSGVLDILQHMKRESPKSGMEQAQETFDELDRVLAPSVAMEEKLSSKILERKDGTCTWLLESDDFTKFVSANGGNTTCLLGGAGSGKSFLMTTMIEHLQKLANEDNSVLVGYFFITRGSDATAQPENVARNLLSQIYRAARGSFEYIDECNAIVRKYLQEQQNPSKMTVKAQKEQLDASLQQTLADIAKLIGKRVYLFVDALDECLDGDPQALVSALQKLIRISGLSINVFFSSRNDGRIPSLLEDSTFINVQDHTSDDIIRIVRTQIDQLPGLTLSERDLVCNEVTRKAGPSFNYVRLAVDFMRRPWRRPLSTHLKSLPEGIDSMYTKSIEQTDPVYKDLLATCLTWTLLSARPLTVREMMDIYQQTYIQDGIGYDDPHSDETHDLKQYEGQINRASSAFLRIEENKTIVTVHTSVREYFSKVQEGNTSVSSDGIDDCRCRRCIIAAQNERAIFVADIAGHIEILTTILKHLLSKSFCSKFYKTLRKGSPNGSLPASRTSSPSRSSKSSIDRSVDDDESIPDLALTSSRNEVSSNSLGNGSTNVVLPHIVSENTGQAEGQRVKPHAEGFSSTVSARPETTLTTSDGNDGSQVADSHNTAETFSSTDSGEDRRIDRRRRRRRRRYQRALRLLKRDRRNSDDSISISTDDEKSSQTDEPSTIADSDLEFRFDDGDEDEDEVNDELATNGTNQDTGLRYEIHNLIWHLVQLENLYPWSKRSGKDWDILKSLLTEFMDVESEAWTRWDHEVRETGTVFETLGINEYYHDSIGTSHPIHVAASAGLNSIVQILLQRGNASTLANLTMPSGKTALFAVFECQARTTTRQDELLETLLSNGASPNVPEGHPPWMSPFDRSLEVAYVWPDQIKLLLSYGAKVREEDVPEAGAMRSFCRGTAGLEVAKLLLEAGADVNQKLLRGERPIHQLMDRKDFPKDVVLEFIKRGAKIDIEDNYSARPLSNCASRGHCEGLTLLLDHGADIEDDNRHGETALHAAALPGHTEAISLLLSRGADPTRLNLKQATPLYLACGAKGNEASALVLIQALIERHGLELALQPTLPLGKTVLMKCVARGFEKAVTVILDNSTATEQLRIRTTMGSQALHFTAVTAKPSITKLLLDRGADSSSQDKLGRTPLQLCYSKVFEPLSEDRESTIMMLVAHDHQAALADKELLNMLIIYASAKASEKLVQLGMDPFLEDSHGWNMLQLAEQYRRTDICDIFRTRKRAGKIRPTKLAFASRSKGYTLSEDGLRVDRLYKTKSFSDLIVLTDHPVPVYEERYYFEVSIELEPEADEPRPYAEITIGLVERPSETFGFAVLGEWSPNALRSWGYHSGGHISSGGRTVTYGGSNSPFGPGDVVGCALQPKKGTLFWTRNGKRLSEGTFEDVFGRLFPAIYFDGRGRAKINLGNDLENDSFKWEPGNRLDFDSDVPTSI